MTVIGIDGLSARSGGGTVYLRNQVTALAASAPSWKFVVFCAPANREDLDVRAGNVSLEVVAENSVARRTVMQLTRFPRVIERFGVDLLYCPGNFVIPRVSVPQVLTLQNSNHFAPLNLQPLLSLKGKRMLQRLGSIWSIQRASATVFISDDSLGNVKRLMRLSRVRYRVISSGIDPVFRDHNAHVPTVKHPRPYVLTVSDIYRHKNLESLFQGFDHLLSHHHLDLDLLVVGRIRDARYHTELRNLLDQIPCGDRIKLLGPVTHCELPALYRGAACYVSTAILEAFPLTPLEAMIQRCPVVVARATSFPQVCGDAALYCDPHDPADVADALARVVTEPALVASLRRKGLDRVRLFSWESNAANLLALFREVLGTWPDVHDKHSQWRIHARLGCAGLRRGDRQPRVV